MLSVPHTLSSPSVPVYVDSIPLQIPAMLRSCKGEEDLNRNTIVLSSPGPSAGLFIYREIPQDYCLLK